MKHLKPELVADLHELRQLCAQQCVHCSEATISAPFQSVDIDRYFALLPLVCQLLPAHDASLLMNAMYDLRTGRVSSFHTQYERAYSFMSQHLSELARLHDELRTFVQGKQLNPTAAQWVQGYLEIFARWQRDGASREPEALMERIVAPVLRLNKTYPGSPFIRVSTENALLCGQWADEAASLKRAFGEAVGDCERAYRKARRMLDIVTVLPGPRKCRLVYFVWLGLIVFIAAMCKFKASAPVVDTPVVDTTVTRLDTAQLVYGLDVSRYQGRLLDSIPHFDSVYFVICKATEGLSLVDPMFYENWRRLEEMGVLRGAYHFFVSSDDPLRQAAFFHNTVGDSSDIPLILDVEAGSLRDSIPADSVHTLVLTCLREMERLLQRRPVLYTNLAFADTYLRDTAFSVYPLWLAEYSGRPSPVLPWAWRETGHTFWQKSASYEVNAEVTDLDLFNGSGEGIVRFCEGR
ncbi:GH25 family lysozyme [Chitinophaga lutea]